MPESSALPLDRYIVIAPGLAGENTDVSVLTQSKRYLREVATRSDNFRLNPESEPLTAGSSLLGLQPGTIRLQPGPLYLSAFGSDPPEKSTQFVLTWAALDESFDVSSEPAKPTQEELEALANLLPKLGTKRLTPVFGENQDHGLVWEDGSLDLGTKGLEQIPDGKWRDHQPEGDGEPLLRNFIDASINLLMEQEFNKRRLGEGKPRLLLLWPWGQGFRESVPNLALQRGSIATYTSSSISLAGLLRLVGYKSTSRNGLFRGMMPSTGSLRSFVEGHGTQVYCVSGLVKSRQSERVDVVEEVWRLIESHVLAPLLQRGTESPYCLTILSPSHAENGLGLIFDNESKSDAQFPFDERLWEYGDAPRRNMWEIVAHLLT